MLPGWVNRLANRADVAASKKLVGLQGPKSLYIVDLYRNYHLRVTISAVILATT